MFAVYTREWHIYRMNVHEVDVIGPWLQNHNPSPLCTGLGLSSLTLLVHRYVCLRTPLLCLGLCLAHLSSLSLHVNTAWELAGAARSRAGMGAGSRKTERQ